MSASNAKPESLKKSPSPISSRTSALAKVLRSQIDIPEYEEQPQVLEQLVNEEGIEGAILHAKAFPTSRKWSLVTSQLRSMLHRLDSDKMGFLELWLEICGHKEETLRALYEKEESFIHSVWKRDVGTNLFQIHHEGVQQFALGDDWVALSHNKGVTIYSIHTAAHVASIVLQSIETLCFAGKALYIISAGSLFCWDGDRCSRIPHVKPHWISSHAGWIALQDQSGCVSILDEDFLFEVEPLCTALAFCRRGLALALGMEDGRVFLCNEGNEAPEVVSLPIHIHVTALFWEAPDRLWIGDEEGGVWLWNGECCSLFAQHHARIMALGRQQEELVVVTLHGQVFCAGRTSYIPEPYSVQVHEKEGVVGLFPRHRFCHFIPSERSGVDRAYLVDGKLWLFHEGIECVSYEQKTTEYSDVLPDVFSTMDGHMALDIQGGVWTFDSRWKKVSQCVVQDIQKSWFYKQEIFTLGSHGLQRFTIEGVQLEHQKSIQYSSLDGVWRLRDDGALLKDGLFQRSFDKIPSHMIVLSQDVVVAQGSILSVYRGTRQLLIYQAHDVITCVAGQERYVVLACQSRCVEVVDIVSKSCVGRYATSAAVIDVTMDARLRILIHQADGSAALVVLDGVQR